MTKKEGWKHEEMVCPYSSLKNPLIPPIPIGRTPYFLLRRLRVRNAILPCNLVPAPLLVLPILLNVPPQFPLELAIERLDLPLLQLKSIALRRLLGVGRERADLIADLVGLGLRRGSQLVELALGGVVGVGAVEGPQVHGCDVLDVGHKTGDLRPEGVDAGEELGC